MKFKTLAPRLALALGIFGGFTGGTGAQAPLVAAAKPTPPVNLSQDPTLYLIGYSHLDTEWRWSYPQVIREFLPNTLHDNFKLFDKYPDYTFNWTGSNRYKLMKEYYPADYARMKAYVAAGRWFPAGSNVEEGDVDMPSEESIIRQVLYGNQFFRHEFGIASNEFTIPDCFGFPASLPSIFAHCGLTGFNTQKLTWGSAVGIPFNVGVWEGPDGQSVVAALNPGAYVSGVPGDMSHDREWIDRVNADGKKSGTYADFRYYGTGDRGGAPGEDDVKRMEASVHGGGPLHVLPSTTAQMFRDITPAQKAGLPRYKGDLLLTQHSAGSLSSQAAMKRWNRKNELLADAAERASVAADWLGAAPYDQARLSDAWLRFLPGQFHDLMAGTALPKSYEFAWNDQIIASNEFAGVLGEAAGGVIRGLDTRAVGIPLVIYNPLSVSRRDVVEASVTFPGSAPANVRVFGPDGRQVPSQMSGRSGNTVKVLFLAQAPSLGYVTYDVRASATSAPADPTLKVSHTGLENARYRVRLDGNGDIASVYDKKAGREMLSGAARLAFLHENPSAFPAWNMDWDDQKQPPRGYVDGPATVRVVENGPARVALSVTREANGSKFVQTIRLSPGTAGERVEIANNIDWRSQECALKAILPLTVSNPLATYNWELGTIQRGNDDPKKYEVPSHRWFDLTDTDGKYGVSVLDDCKYGSDKPTDDTVRLTLLYTPGVRGGYQDQATQDWGRHEFTYALAGHAGDWRNGTQWQAARLNQPLIAFQTTPHAGALGRSFSFGSVSTAQVSVEALKKAEDSSEVIVRVNELSGQAAPGVRLSLAAPIVAAREVDGQERPLGPATVEGGKLVFSMDPYRPRAFALTLGTAPLHLSPPQSVPIPLPYDASMADGVGAGITFPDGTLPRTVQSNGVTFTLGTDHNNVVSCVGQSLALPAGAGRRVSLLMASKSGDTAARFGIIGGGGKPVTLAVQAWDGTIGQWDNRIWGGDVPELTYDWNNPMLGLTPGFIKRAPVAWYADHKRLPDGTNDPYQFCYLFRYDIPVPDGARALQLPDNARVRILAATVSHDHNADVQAAQPLYDVLERVGGRTPTVETAAGPYQDSTVVTLGQPFYTVGTIRYTLDGTTPGLKSASYVKPFRLAKTAIIKTAQVDATGRTGPVGIEKIVVNDVTPPTVVSADAVPADPNVSVTFSEPVTRASAEDVAHYVLSPAVGIKSAALGADGQTVTLALTAPLAGNARLSVSDIRDVSPVGNAIARGASVSVGLIKPVFEKRDVETIHGPNDGFSQDNAAGLPVKADAPWTINVFVYTDTTPEELTSLAGFGDDTDSAGQQRYLIKFHDGIHFWGSNVDVTSGVPFDLGKWQMVTATFDGTTVRLYKNGAEIKSAPVLLGSAAPTVKVAPPGPWGDRGHRFNGKIAGFTIWDRALGADSLKALLAGMPQ